MHNREIELDPVDFLTVGTVGPKGRRVFYVQAGKGVQVVTLIIEKQQAQALADAIIEMLDDLKSKHPDLPESEINLAHWDMSLREPIEPLFRVAQMGLGHDIARNLVVLVAQELVVTEGDAIEDDPQIVRMWATREQLRALSEHTREVVRQGRANPKSNGHLVYYWT